MKTLGKRAALFYFAVWYLAYTAVYIARLNLSTVAPFLRDAAILSSEQIGVLGTAFSCIFATGRLFNGFLSDRVRPAVMIAVGLAGAGCANLALTALPSFVGFILLWGLNAYGQSMIWASVTVLVSEGFGEKKSKKVGSYMVTAVATGNIVGILLSLSLAEKVGTKYAFLIPGAIAVFFAAAVLATTYKFPPLPRGENNPGIFAPLKHREIVDILPPIFCHGIMKDNVPLWMTLYVVDIYDVNLSEMAIFIVFIPLVGLVGRLLFPILFRVFGEDEHKVSTVGFIVCAAVSVSLFFQTNFYIGVTSLAVIYAAASLINTGFTVFPMKFREEGILASVGGLFDFVCYFGAGIGSLVFGLLVDGFGYLPMFAAFAAVSVFSIIWLQRFRKKYR